jgi:hypothetical protein
MIAAGWWRLALYRTPPRGPAPRAAHDENMLRVAGLVSRTGIRWEFAADSVPLLCLIDLTGKMPAVVNCE